jgi:hypothetical protein
LAQEELAQLQEAQEAMALVPYLAPLHHQVVAQVEAQHRLL